MPKRPDLTEKKSKRFVSEHGGRVRFVDSREMKETWLDRNLISDRQAIDVLFRCEMCGKPVSSYVVLAGEEVGLECRCALRRARSILKDDAFSTAPKADVEKAALIVSNVRKEFLIRLLRVIAKPFRKDSK